MVETSASPWRIVFFGTPDFAVPTLQALIDSPCPVVGVVTQPDKPRGRGQQVTSGPVKLLADAHGIPVMQPARLKDEAALDALRAMNADLGVVAAYGKILPAAVLDMPRHGLINVHASILPKYRGAAPVHRAVMAGETETGVSIMRVVQALDAGGVYAVARRPIGPDDTSADVEQDLALIGARALMAVIGDMVAGRAEAMPQDDAASTYASRLLKEEGPIDWRISAAAVHNRVRGLQPWPLACTFLHGRRLIVIRSRVPSALTAAAVPAASAGPGTVIGVSRDAITVQTGDGLLDVLVVQPEGRRAMNAGEFIAGHPLAPGSSFDAPV